MGSNHRLWNKIGPKFCTWIAPSGRHKLWIKGWSSDQDGPRILHKSQIKCGCTVILRRENFEVLIINFLSFTEKRNHERSNHGRNPMCPPSHLAVTCVCDSLLCAPACQKEWKDYVSIKTNPFVYGLAPSSLTNSRISYHSYLVLLYHHIYKFSLSFGHFSSPWKYATRSSPWKMEIIKKKVLHRSKADVKLQHTGTTTIIKILKQFWTC